MLSLTLNDALVVLSLERAPHYGNGVPRAGFKGVVKTLLCKVSEDLIDHLGRRQDTNSNWHGGNISMQTCILLKFLLSFQLETMVFFLTNSLKCIVWL